MTSMCDATGDTTAASFLESVPLFADLSPAELRELSWLVSPFACGPGERLFRQGDPGDALYCIDRGLVGLTVRSPGGSDVLLAEVGPADVVGEMALLDSGPRCASAVALEPTFGYVLPAPAFHVLRAALRPGAFKVLRRLTILLTTRLRAHAGHTPGGDPVRVDAPPARTGGESALAGLRSPARDLDRSNLMRFPTFRDFSADELEELLGHATVLSVPRGHVLFREGDAARSCFVVIRGAALLCVERGGEQRKLAVEGPGGILGHLALIDPAARSATCVTRASSILLEIDRQAFDAMVASTSGAAVKLFGALAECLSVELRRVNQRMGLLALSV